MVSCSWKLQLISPFVVPNVVLWSSHSNLLAKGSDFRFRPHLSFGATCRSRWKLSSESRTNFASTTDIVREGEYKSGDWGRNRSRTFPSARALAEGHESHNSDHLLLSSDGDTVLANEVPGLSEDQRWVIVKQNIAGLSSNARKHSLGIEQIRHSLGVDFGDVKTGVSISLKGYAPRPLPVVRMRGDKLIEQLLDIAGREKVDEFIVGLPRSSDGKETVQSNKTRSFAGRLAGQAALRGWRVYLQDEYGSSQDGLDYMLEMGMKKRSRKEKIDAYAAVVLLSTYFNSKGEQVQLVVPKGLSAQESLCLGPNSVGENQDRAEDYDLDEADSYEYDD